MYAKNFVALFSPIKIRAFIINLSLVIDFRLLTNRRCSLIINFLVFVFIKITSKKERIVSPPSKLSRYWLVDLCAPYAL